MRAGKRGDLEEVVVRNIRHLMAGASEPLGDLYTQSDPGWAQEIDTGCGRFPNNIFRVEKESAGCGGWPDGLRSVRIEGRVTQKAVAAL